MSKHSLREEMPAVTRIIDGFRAAFGKAYIDGIIRAGMRGQPVFWASENGHTIGTPLPPAAVADSVDPSTENNRERHYRQARARYLAVMGGDAASVQTSAPPTKGKR